MFHPTILFLQRDCAAEEQAPCWAETEMREDICTAAPLSDGPFMTRWRGFCTDTDVCPGFQGLFWDEWAAGLAAAGSR